MCESYADQSDAESTRVEDMEEDMDSFSNDTSSEPHKPDEEPSILEPVPEEPPIVAEPVTFTLVENGTSRGKTSLVDSLGFTYNVHSKRPYATYWQCTMRPKGNPCKASVTERDGTFQAGKSAKTILWRWELLRH